MYQLTHVKINVQFYIQKKMFALNTIWDLQASARDIGRGKDLKYFAAFSDIFPLVIDIF